MKRAILMAMAILMSLSSACQATEPLKPGGQIDWYKGESTQIEVVGVGEAPTYVTGILQSKKIARDAAMRNAYHMLTKIINELQVDAGRTVFSLTVDNEAAREKIADLIMQAKLIHWSEDQDKAYLSFRVNMFGADGVAKIALGALKDVDAKAAPRLAPTSKKVSDNMKLEDVYSGIIVDARNIGFTLNLLPKIYDDSGRLIYEYRDADSDFLISKGLVDYQKNNGNFSLAGRGSALSGRAGIKPMIVKALKTADNGQNIIISAEDADKILEQNVKWGLFKICSVVFAL